MFRRRKKDRPDIAPIDDLGREIQAVLRDDIADGRKLAHPGSQAGGWEFDGYCAAASAAYFFMKGGREAGYQPMQRTDGDSSHWWLVDSSGRIIDLNIGPNDDPGDFPYEEGGPKGYMMTGYKKPASRAAEIMERVRQRRGE